MSKKVVYPNTKNVPKRTETLPKILIAIPSNRDLPKEFVARLLPLAAQVGVNNVCFMQNGMINQCRDSIFTHAYKNDYEYIMWLDDDMLMPPDTITRLLAHKKDIVSGLYYNRGDYKPLIYGLDYDDSDDTYSFSQMLEYPDNQLIKVGAVGFGCVLTKVETLTKVWTSDIRGTSGTCFDFIGGVGEDLSFGIRCKELGIETWVDTSLKLGHMGKFTVTETAYLACKDEILQKAKQKEQEQAENKA